MDSLADAAVPPPPDPVGRSFALLDEAERAPLRRLLRPLPWIDGLIAATVITAAARADALGEDDPDAEDDEALDWLYLIWKDGSEAEIGSLTMAESAAFLNPAVAHFVHVGDALAGEPETYRPYLADANNPLAAASLWGAGFWAGLSIEPEIWSPLLEDADALPLLVAILSLVRDEDMPDGVKDDADSPFRGMSADQRQHMRSSTIEMLPEIVISLHDHVLGLDAPDDLG